VLLACEVRRRGAGQGPYGATIEIDPESAVTPWLIACWLAVVTKGFRRAHAVLSRYYHFEEVRSGQAGPWEKTRGYFFALLGGGSSGWPSAVMVAANRYSFQTGLFLFGLPSQQRLSGCV